MILEKIKNFDWYNEPKNVRFIEEGILVETHPNTDFWQCLDSNFSKELKKELIEKGVKVY